MHRSHSWNGRGTIYRSGEDLELSTVSLIENSLCEELQKQSLRKAPAGALPPLARSPGVSRSPPKGTSRLRHVVSSSDEEDDVKPAFPIGERMPSMKMASGTGGSYSGGRAAMFRMMKSGQSTSKIYS
jgi:hypothetical protein